MAVSLLADTDTATRDISDPMNLLPSFRATAPVVPHHMKKSATISQGFDRARISFSSNFSDRKSVV